MQLRSIRWRLVITSVLLALLSVVLVGALALTLIRSEIERHERAALEANGVVIAQEALPLLWRQSDRQAVSQLAAASSFLRDLRVRILGAEGEVLADSGQPTGGNFIVITEAAGGQGFGGIIDEKAVLDKFGAATIMRSAEGKTIIQGDSFTMEKLEVMPDFPVAGHALIPGRSDQPRSEQVLRLPVGPPDKTLGYVEVSGVRSDGAETLATARRALSWAAVAAVLVALLVALLISRQLTRPLYALATAAEGMAAGDLSARAPVRGKDELGQLARQFNVMAERLQASFAALASERDALQRFIADASHELRTPITALKTFNELLQGRADQDPSVRAEFLLESQVQLGRLEWITANLLDLSRLDAGIAELQPEPTEAGELLEHVVRGTRTIAEERGVALELEAPAQPLELRCDRARMGMALSNLLDNALKFTPAGGHVVTGASVRGAQVELWVRDSGPGIPREDLPHIFERFYRGRCHGAPGSGLGLAIVASIVQAHGGQVVAESEPGAGARFAILLPASY